MTLTRREVVAGAAASSLISLTSAASAQPAASPGEDRVFICNEDSNTLSIIDPRTNTLAGEIPLALIKAMVVSPETSTVPDQKPLTSPLTSPLLVMNMAATLFRMTVEECLAGVTRQAARALGLASEVGTLEAGKRCDLAIWNIERPAELVYRMGFNPLHARVWRGN